MRLVVFTLIGLAAAVAPAPAQAPAPPPVTDAMLQDPAPGDWLMWRRTLNGWGYSPLDQVDRENVNRLRLVWTRGLSSGYHEGTPLVYGGTLYMPNPNDHLQAIEAATGDLLRGYRRETPEGAAETLAAAAGLVSVNRNVAIYGNVIIDTGNDGYVYAVDAATGELAWETEIFDYATGAARHSSGPIVANGKVETGEVLWEINLGSPVTGFPISFAVDGRQYVAVSTGTAASASAFVGLTPELRPSYGNNLFVFGLPE